MFSVTRTKITTTTIRQFTRPISSTATKMSEKYTVKQTGAGGMASQESTPATAGVGEHKPGMFDAEGAIGKQFTTEGALGGTAQKVGGPFDKEGAIGKQFTTDGAVGGTVQENLGGTSKTDN